MDKTSKHIYFVDDDDFYRKSLVRLLTFAGYFVESFSSGQSFLDSVAVAHETGVLILDLRMPGMNGFAQQIANSYYNRRCTTRRPRHAVNAGAIGFLQKPLEEESLLELIRPAGADGH